MDLGHQPAALEAAPCARQLGRSPVLEAPDAVFLPYPPLDRPTYPGLHARQHVLDHPLLPPHPGPTAPQVAADDPLHGDGRPLAPVMFLSSKTERGGVGLGLVAVVAVCRFRKAEVGDQIHQKAAADLSAARDVEVRQAGAALREVLDAPLADRGAIRKVERLQLDGVRNDGEPVVADPQAPLQVELFQSGALVHQRVKAHGMDLGALGDVELLQLAARACEHREVFVQDLLTSGEAQVGQLVAVLCQRAHR
mmetsp:Transcript_82384/g.233106  ORF Transcript_82384/g.233106 Transcript_82384/m.233106 type:complete len:252 (-) Transcript_82384:1280-2035(-)